MQRVEGFVIERLRTKIKAGVPRADAIEQVFEEIRSRFTRQFVSKLANVGIEMNITQEVKDGVGEEIEIRVDRRGMSDAEVVEQTASFLRERLHTLFGGRRTHWPGLRQVYFKKRPNQVTVKYWVMKKDVGE